MSLFRPARKLVGITLIFPTTYYSDVCFIAEKHDINVRNGTVDGTQSSLYVESQEDEHKLSLEICKELELAISVPSNGWSEDWREFCTYILHGTELINREDFIRREMSETFRCDCPEVEDAPELEKGPERIVCS